MESTIRGNGDSQGGKEQGTAEKNDRNIVRQEDISKIKGVQGMVLRTVVMPAIEHGLESLR